jgi:predicted MFS family arabinose efflux permease
MILLAVAAFASQATVRAADTLLPQIAAEFDTTVGTASIAVAAYAVAHGGFLFAAGPIGDRFGKVRVVTLACLASALAVLLCACAQSLFGLAVARFASGIAVAWIVPLGLAFVGDVVSEERRQQVLARYLSGQILGQLFGQAMSGVLADHLGWRGVFFVLVGLFLFAGAALMLVRRPAIEPKTNRSMHGLCTGYVRVLSEPWARVILIAVFFEGMLSFGVFAYVSSDLHIRFGLSFTEIGAIVALFALGGLVTAAAADVLVKRLGQVGMAILGGLMMSSAYMVLVSPYAWWMIPPAIGAIGIGFYVFHNTLLTHATKMCPQFRATAVSTFGTSLYLGQTAGVTVAAPFVDHLGAPVVFLASAVFVPMLAVWLAIHLRRRCQAEGAQMKCNLTAVR